MNIKPNSKTPHLRYIDALRGVAVAAVVVVHTAAAAHVAGSAGRLFAFGSKGVQIFYVVSAFTLMLSMSNRNQSERAPLSNFFLRRFFRIAPAFYVILFVCYLSGALAPHLTGIPPTSYTHTLLIALFLNGWRPDIINAPITGQWSVVVEFSFYALLPFIFPLLTTFRRAVYGWVISLLIYIISYPLAIRLAAAEGFSSPETVHDFSYWWFPNQLPVFMCGIGLYFIVTQRRSIRSLAPYLVGSVLIFACHRFYPGVGLLPPVAVTIMSAVVFLSRWPTRVVVNSATRFLGKISFSIYLCHPLVLKLITVVIDKKAISDPLLRFAILYLATLVLGCPVALLMWKFIEMPGQVLGKQAILWKEAHIWSVLKQPTDEQKLHARRASNP